MVGFFHGWVLGAQYEQIKMHLSDKKHTSFRTPFGVYCYTVMPFGLKNAGATYQRAMTRICKKHFHKTVECYVDDLVVKRRIPPLGSQKSLRGTKGMNPKMRMNPLKCFLGVSSGKFLGFVVTKDGIMVDPAKIQAILDMRPPTNLRELKGLQGRLAYIRRFISKLSGRCAPFTRLMRKGVDFVWDKECDNAFNNIKQYLTQPPVLAAPIQGRPFILYTRALDHSLGAMLAQKDDEGHSRALYYLSRMMIGAEHKYTPVEKECLALMFAVQKMRHYLAGQTTYLISRVNPRKVLMTKAGSLNLRLAKWSILLSQYDLVYEKQKVVKGSTATCCPGRFPRSTSASGRFKVARRSSRRNNALHRNCTRRHHADLEDVLR
jgi:hypothetical protein